MGSKLMMRMVVRRMMMIMMTMTMMKTCGDVPECVQDWQVELADKVKRLALALFHLAIVIFITINNNNVIIIISRKQWSVTLFTSSMNIATSSLISPSIPAFPKPKSLIAA